MKVKARALGIFVAAACGCGPAARTGQPDPATARAATMLPDVRIAKDRPPVVVIARDGDPTGALAFAVTTSGLADSRDTDPALAAALAGVVEARLAARNFAPLVTPSSDGFRGSLLVASETDLASEADAVRAAFASSVDDRDLAAARAKLATLGARSLRDPALAAWARCVGSPHAASSRADGSDLTAAKLEQWRSSAFGVGRVAVAVAGRPAVAEGAARAILRGAPWRTVATPTGLAATDTVDAEVYQAPLGEPFAPTLHVALDVGTGSSAVAIAEALGDPRGPLAGRLAALELPFRVREVIGTAHARGGCVGVALEALPGFTGATKSVDLAARAADAFALVFVEAQTYSGAGNAAADGRKLARRTGHARDAAERAAWWALVDTSLPQGPNPASMHAAIALGVPARRGIAGLGDATRAEAPAMDPSRDALASALVRARAAWERPIVESRTRVEAGQGEVWVLLASPCGTEGETDADAGLTALVAAATAVAANTSPEARVEPWIVADGAGLVVHGPALAGESPRAHARRLADVVAQSFAAATLTPTVITRARAELLASDAREGAGAFGALGSALAPQRPSAFFAWGREDVLTHASDAAVLARAQALRAGPLRVAVLANVDANQADAATRAADRWVDRRTAEPRTCRSATTFGASRPGTYAIEPRVGAPPEAFLAFPFAAGNEGAYAAATLVAAALEGSGGLLDKALGGGAGLARASSARVLGWPRAPALVVRVVSTQSALDSAVLQARALMSRLHGGGLAAADLERAAASVHQASISAALDPRARVAATWRGEAIPSTAQPARVRASADDVRVFAQKSMGEDAMIVVAARPGRVKTP